MALDLRCRFVDKISVMMQVSDSAELTLPHISESDSVLSDIPQEVQLVTLRIAQLEDDHVRGYVVDVYIELIDRRQPRGESSRERVILG